MSILSDFYNKNAPDKPNEVHDLPADPQIRSDTVDPDTGSAHFPILHGANVFVSPDACGMRMPDLAYAPDAQNMPIPDFPGTPDAYDVPIPDFPDFDKEKPSRVCPPNRSNACGTWETLTPDARRRMHSLKERQLHPALYYTPDQTIPSDSGVWESRRTVDEKLNVREEFPYG